MCLLLYLIIIIYEHRGFEPMVRIRKKMLELEPLQCQSYSFGNWCYPTQRASLHFISGSHWKNVIAISGGHFSDKCSDVLHWNSAQKGGQKEHGAFCQVVEKETKKIRKIDFILMFLKWCSLLGGFPVTLGLNSFSWPVNTTVMSVCVFRWWKPSSSSVSPSHSPLPSLHQFNFFYLNYWSVQSGSAAAGFITL